jgi:hypothetical protein
MNILQCLLKLIIHIIIDKIDSDKAVVGQKESQLLFGYLNMSKFLTCKRVNEKYFSNT